MTVTRSPFILQRHIAGISLKNWWKRQDDFIKSMLIVFSICALFGVAILSVVQQNGVANCHDNYGKDYSYDMDSEKPKCLNKATGERKPIVVKAQQ